MQGRTEGGGARVLDGRQKCLTPDQSVRESYKAAKSYTVCEFWGIDWSREAPIKKKRVLQRAQQPLSPILKDIILIMCLSLRSVAVTQRKRQLNGRIV